MTFLSCLYGSERRVFLLGQRGVFLSCLYGSELLQFTANRLF